MADTEKRYLDQNGLARLVANMDVAYAQKEHTHDYSPTDHNHDDRYYTESEIDSKLSGKANTNHGTHVPTIETANDARYLRNDNTWQTITPAKIGAATSGHTHTSDKVTAMTGYSKPDSTSAIDKSDTLNAAIGKLEKALDGKQASGSYAASSHTHDDRYYTETEMNTKLDAKVPTSRTVNGKALSANITLSASDVGASATGHTHDDRYYTESEVDSKLSGKAASSHTHVAGDITSVNASAIQGTIAAANLPSYVDDVLEGYYNSSDSKFYKSYSSGTYSSAYTGETGKIYVDLSTNKTYRWSGSAYVVVSETLALGTTSSTAYRGDFGDKAYKHAVTNKGAAFDSGLYKITTNAEGHVTAATTVVKDDITALGIPAQDTVYTHPTTSGNKHIPSGGSAGQFLKWSADGTAVWAADNNTDTKVTQTVRTDNVSYPLLLAPSGQTATTTTTANFGTKFQANPSTGALTATTFVGALSGKATSAATADTAAAFSANKSVALTGDVTGSASSTGGWSVATTLANSGVTAGSYGPSANATPAHSGTFSVPYITVDAKGRVTAASTKTITLPADANTHYTSKNVVGSSTATSNTTTALTNGNVYLNSVENGAVTSAHKISGTGGVTVTTDASGNIAVNHSTSAGYKHIPSGGSSGQVLAWSASGTAAWSNIPSITDDEIDAMFA